MSSTTLVSVHSFDNPPPATSLYFTGPPIHNAAATFASIYCCSTSTYLSTTLLELLRHLPRISIWSRVQPTDFAYVAGYFQRLCVPRLPVPVREMQVAMKELSRKIQLRRRLEYQLFSQLTTAGEVPDSSANNTVA